MIAIIDSGGANIGSVLYALERLGFEAKLTQSATEIKSASKVILPGVGACKDSMDRLQERGLIEMIPELTQPVLGICLGMQLLFESSEEGPTPCLGIVEGNVKKFDLPENYTIPHMGWNAVNWVNENHPLAKGIAQGSHFYFVHSYHAPIKESTSFGICEYGHDFTATVQRDNFFGAQFHPERSGVVGAQFLRNFLEL